MEEKIICVSGYLYSVWRKFFNFFFHTLIPQFPIQVDKIFGPGNQYVTAAKMILQNSEALVSIDMPAGPSEVLVIADEKSDPQHVAIDLLSQAEHGPDSQVGLCECWFIKN